MKPFYVKHKTEEEAREIIELAVENGADEYETVESMNWRHWKYVGVDEHNDTVFYDYYFHYDENATEMTIEEVRKMFEKKSDVSDKWMPEVGNECEINTFGDVWVVGACVAHDVVDNINVAIIRYRDDYNAYSSKCVRPLKTKDEIKREETINEMKIILRGHSIIDHQAHYLYASGYRKLKENEAIVKPLSDDQIETIRVKWSETITTVNDIIEMTQRELGVIE